ncbi:MAG: hypothetical protein ACODAE_02205 [Gemmatimonadota bacterium]
MAEERERTSTGAGTEGGRDDPTSSGEHRRGRRPELESDEGAGATRDADRAEGGEEGIAGEGPDQSGTVSGSTGGVTGTSGHSGGTQSPGSRGAGFPGISPEEARRLRRRRRREGR